MMNNIKQIHVKPNQTIWDIALENFGAIDGVFSIIKHNSLPNGVNENFATPQVLNIDVKVQVNEDVLLYYKRNNVQPATAGVEIKTACLNPYVENGYFESDYIACEEVVTYVENGYINDNYFKP